MIFKQLLRNNLIISFNFIHFNMWSKDLWREIVHLKCFLEAGDDRFFEFSGVLVVVVEIENVQTVAADIDTVMSSFIFLAVEVAEWKSTTWYDHRSVFVEGRVRIEIIIIYDDGRVDIADTVLDATLGELVRFLDSAGPGVVHRDDPLHQERIVVDHRLREVLGEVGAAARPDDEHGCLDNMLMPLRLVTVKELRADSLLDGAGQLPSQVHGVSVAGVASHRAEGGPDMCGITDQERIPLPEGLGQVEIPIPMTRSMQLILRLLDSQEFFNYFFNWLLECVITNNLIELPHLRLRLDGGDHRQSEVLPYDIVKVGAAVLLQDFLVEARRLNVHTLSLVQIDEAVIFHFHRLSHFRSWSICANNIFRLDLENFVGGAVLDLCLDLDLFIAGDRRFNNILVAHEAVVVH